MTKVNLTLLTRKEKKGYSIACPELDVASQGSTEDAAVANLHEAVELYVESMKELNRFDIVLDGIEFANQKIYK